MLSQLNDVDLRMLRIFCAIVQAGGFTAAQAHLNISLSRLSLIMRDLEIRLGYALCKRGNSGFHLTEQGQGTYQAALELFANIAQFRQKTLGFSGGLQGQLKVGSVDRLDTLPNTPMPKAIAGFRQAHPQTHIQLHIMRTDELEQAVLEERLHIALGAFYHQLSGLHYYPLFNERQSLYCSNTHPFFAQDETTLCTEQIESAAYVERGYVADNVLPHGLHFKNGVTAFCMEAIATLILSGCYIGYLPQHYAKLWTQQGTLKALLPKRLSFDAAFHMIVRSGQLAHPQINAFLQALQQSAAPVNQQTD
ncbi:LysR family transcriptional regulator [Ventosimonas gracilis]|uniref:LysR family transcriptional regulator n=2 Tax=Ventosimonas gracilis TaxID=1680762 RepID=A0A139SRQ0_9GAMM|nr:LysR family transcriptional regulator [Ventosimonas gracilis]